MLSSLLLFSATAALLTITPGLDTALVLRTAVNEGRRAALAAGIGICCGVLAWGVIVACGLGALLHTSALAYTLLRVIGAGWLLWLGVQLLRRRSEPAANPDATREAGGNWFWRGVLTNLLNPKVGLFYLTFLPQFLQPQDSVLWMSLTMALIHALEGVIWFALLVLVAARASAWLQAPAVRRGMDRLLGVAFIGFGAKLALDH
ncbi:LysE family translocator [Vogesella sp. LIG4]|uniref:LysE family translocator n=1 Tax=Vogesella sp. LIG4 TaxID=1192162 RepID=UPI00081FF1B2|nr:LysE family translocator [Vogesella sp. LIG4]SCK29884.1 resistance to homoserine/threonine (RhtB) family protein [Vogesella sp. LIG4]